MRGLERATEGRRCKGRCPQGIQEPEQEKIFYFFSGHVHESAPYPESYKKPWKACQQRNGLKERPGSGEEQGWEREEEDHLHPLRSSRWEMRKAWPEEPRRWEVGGRRDRNQEGAGWLPPGGWLTGTCWTRGAGFSRKAEGKRSAHIKGQR